MVDAQETTVTVNTSGTITADTPVDQDSYFDAALQADADTSDSPAVEMTLDGSGSLLGLLELTVDESVVLDSPIV